MLFNNAVEYIRSCQQYRLIILPTPQRQQHVKFYEQKFPNIEMTCWVKKYKIKIFNFKT